jgi:hypothetical protein
LFAISVLDLWVCIKTSIWKEEITGCHHSTNDDSA